MYIPSACPTKRVIHIKDFVAEPSKPLQGNFLLCGGGGGVAGCRREEFQGEGEVNLML